MQCLTSFSCQRSFPDPATIGISAPGGAQCQFGANTAINSFENKKPGNKRRASPSTLCGCLYPRSLQNGYARCSIVSNPVLVSNLTSCRVGRSGSSGDFPTNQGSANIKGVYQNTGIRQAVFTFYLSASPLLLVNISDPVEIGCAWANNHSIRCDAASSLSVWLDQRDKSCNSFHSHAPCATRTAS
jgi:hypothetical protein